jgi:hypothetical protein
MSSKIIGISICALVLEASFVFAQERLEQERMEMERMSPERMEGRFSCPDLNDKSSFEGWALLRPVPVLDHGEAWYAYDAWILPPESQYNMYPAYTAQCNYIALKPGGGKSPAAKQIVFGKKINPTDYDFQNPHYTTSKNPALQKECSPWKKGVVSINHYPPECDFVPNTAGAYRNEKYQ